MRYMYKTYDCISFGINLVEQLYSPVRVHSHWDSSPGSYSVVEISLMLHRPMNEEAASAEEGQFNCTMEPPIIDPPTRGQPLYKGHS